MKIPFGKPFQVTPAQLKDGIAQGIVDGYIDHDGAYKSRVGLTAYRTLDNSQPVDGIYIDKSGREVSVAGGVVFVDGVACTGSTLNIGTLCTFAEDPDYVFIAHGGYIAKVEVASRVVSLLNSGTGVPNGVTHVVYLQGYLLSNGTNGIVGDTFFTGTNTSADYLNVWEVFNNESLPDGCAALMEDGQFVYAFGSKSVEVSNNDGVTPWAKYGISYIPYGIHAPYSVTKIDNSFFWLGEADNSLRVLKMKGNAAVTISTPYDAVISAMTTTDDAYGYSCGIEGHTFYVLTFPTEEMTLVYHLQSDAWYRWAYYNVDGASYEIFLGRCCAYNPDINRNVVGLRTGGIATLDGFNDMGALIRCELTSGNITADTYKQKRASRMRFQLQRGETTSSTETPVMTWQTRDDGRRWSAERRISLNSRGHYDYIGQLDRALGIYRERQHRIVMTDLNCQLVFVACEEQTKVMGD